MSFSRPGPTRDSPVVRPDNGQTAQAGFESRYGPPVRYSREARLIHKVKLYLDSYYCILSALDLWRDTRDASRKAKSDLSIRFASYEVVIRSLQEKADQLQIVDSQLRLDGQNASHLDEAPFEQLWSSYRGASRCMHDVGNAFPQTEADGNISDEERQRSRDEVANLARSFESAYVSLAALQKRLIEEIKALVKQLADELPDMEEEHARVE